jgi:hypothetical protein
VVQPLRAVELRPQVREPAQELRQAVWPQREAVAVPLFWWQYRQPVAAATAG